MSSHEGKQRPPRWTSPLSFFGLSVYRLFILMVLVDCVATHVWANTLTGCVPTYDPSLDYFPDKITQTHSEDYNIQYQKSYKVLTNTRTSETFVLYQCGTPMPTGFSNTTKIFPVPFSSLAITSTVEIRFLELLGLRTAIKYVAYPQYVTSPCIQKMVLSGAIQSLSTNDTIRDQQIASVDGIFEFSKDASNNKSISVSTSQDPGTLHRVGWIGFMAAFFNQEAKANQVYNLVASRYDCVSTIAYSSSVNPKIAWVDSYPTFKIDIADYKLEFISDLGATPIAPVVNTFTNVKDWQNAVKDADIIIDETYGGDMNTFYSTFNLSSSSTEYKFIKNGQVWRFDKLQSDYSGLDWFEGAVVNADAVLEDLLTIAKPALNLPHTRIWFRNSFLGEAVNVEGAGKCVDPTAPAELASDDCVVPSPTPSPTSGAASASAFASFNFIAVFVTFFLAFGFMA